MGPIGPISSVAAWALSALGVINPRFTPADLVRSSAQILLLEVSAPSQGALAARVVETLKGPPLPQLTFAHMFLAGDAGWLDDGSP